jgi:hypothetical protein
LGLHSGGEGATAFLALPLLLKRTPADEHFSQENVLRNRISLSVLMASASLIALSGWSDAQTTTPSPADFAACNLQAQAQAAGNASGSASAPERREHVDVSRVLDIVRSEFIETGPIRLGNDSPGWVLRPTRREHI